jgi:cobalt-zinc-cadmium efflux system outer membrane protein
MKWCCSVACFLLLACLGGCHNPLNDKALIALEAEYRSLAAASLDLDRSCGWTTPQPITAASKTVPDDSAGSPIQLASAAEQIDMRPPRRQRKATLIIPPELPGSDDPGFQLPKDPANLNNYLQEKYPPLEPLEPDVLLAAGPEGRPMTLADLQRLATDYSPVVRSAEAAVSAARGAVRQSLAYPNPSFFFEADTVETLPAGYEGFGIDQVIKTGNKLELAGAAATMDLFNAQLALRRARLDVAYQVRSGYFAVLVAQENVKLSRVFARFTDEIYAAQIGLLKGKEAAAYEPMQLRPLALQARFNLIQAINQYRASWRQLAASMGLPDMPPSEVTGRVDLPVPQFDYEQAKYQIVNRHTDVLTAQNNIHKADYLLRLARIQPIPDVDVHLLIQKDYTTPPNNTVHSIAVTVPVPVWDQNRGAIQQAQGLWMQAMQNLPAARNTLTSSLADAYNRYSTAKKQVEIALAQTKDQVRVYKAVYTRFRGGDAAVTFGDVVAAQQTLAGYLTGYLSALGLQWTAVVDMANLLQTGDLFKGTAGKDDPDLPPLDELETMLHCPQGAPSISQASPSRARLQWLANTRETDLPNR